MELRAYWAIIWRRIWIVAFIVVIVTAYVAYQYAHLRKTSGTLTAYQSTITMQIGLQPIMKGEDPSTADSVTVSESLADTLATGPVLTFAEFDTQVSHQIGLDMPQIVAHYGAHPDLGNWQDVKAIGAALSATRTHSLVTINAIWETPLGAQAIAHAVGEVSVANIGTYLNYVVSNPTPHVSTSNTIQPTVSVRVVSNATDAMTVLSSSSNKVIFLGLLLLVALLIGIALAFLIDYLDDRIYTKDDASLLLQLPVYGDKTCHALYANICFDWASKPTDSPTLHTLLIIPPASLTGTKYETVIANVATAAAQSGTSVIMVDTDVHNPKLPHHFGVAEKRGFCDLLQEETITHSQIAACLDKTSIPGLSLLCAGTMTQQSAAMFYSAKSQEVIHSLYQYIVAIEPKPSAVIFNSPPVLDGPEASIVSSLVDQTVLLIIAGRTTRSQARQAQEQLQHARANLTGIILLQK